MCLSGIDLAENLGVVYHLYSMVHTHKLVMRTEVPKEKPDVKSVAMLWRTADWHEREAFDMFGINFIQHPELKRILLPDDWTGFPLRKDYIQPEFYNGIRVPHPDQKKEANDSD
jgi:NADH-quinone oxidoreductase subunit C